MKLRVWGGRPTLATEQGKELETFAAFESWLKHQPDGQIEVWAGRWFAVSREARPFVVESGKTFCDYRPYFGKLDGNPRDFPGFFAFEAWKRAKMTSDFWASTQKMAGDMLDSAKGGEDGKA